MRLRNASLLTRRGCYELARQLVAAGIPDQGMRITSANLAGHMSYVSFHKAAGRTFEENAQTVGQKPALSRF